MRAAFAVTLVLWAAAGAAAARGKPLPKGPAKAATKPLSTAEASMADLFDGNGVFRKNAGMAKRRAATAQSQAPQAVIVGCSDSRVPPEAVFNRFVGRLFVVRTAGHAIGDYELASIEYAVEHLHAPLVIVMGHERCGAVKATVDATGGSADEGGSAGEGAIDEHALPPDEVPRDHLGALIAYIKPAVDEARKAPSGDLLDASVKAHTRLVTARLTRESGVLREAVEKGALRIVGARYDLDTGAVELLQ